jgi:uncharacterized protein YndB with AHSA1/START domain
MKIVKWLLGLIVFIAVAFVAIGFVLPREVSVARSIDIDAPPSTIFPHLNNHRATEAWSPWLAKDPETKVTYEGPEAGVGAKMAWDSDNPQVGKGTSEITASEPDRRVAVALDFGEMGTADSAYDLEAAGGTTKVTWSFKTDMGAGPVGRWMGLMMDGWVGADFEQGLSNLKDLVERGDQG